MAFVSGLAVKGVRLLPPNRHLDKMDVGTRAKWAISVMNQLTQDEETVDFLARKARKINSQSGKTGKDSFVPLIV